MAARRGRPPLAPDSQHYTLRLPASVMDKVDRFAASKKITRAAALRLLLEHGLRTIKARRSR